MQVNWLKDSGFGGLLVWLIDDDDFSGSFCGSGPYPLMRQMNLVLEGSIPTTTTSPPTITTTTTSVSVAHSAFHRALIYLLTSITYLLTLTYLPTHVCIFWHFAFHRVYILVRVFLPTCRVGLYPIPSCATLPGFNRLEALPVSYLTKCWYRHRRVASSVCRSLYHCIGCLNA